MRQGGIATAKSLSDMKNLSEVGQLASRTAGARRIWLGEGEFSEHIALRRNVSLSDFVKNNRRLGNQLQ